MKEVEVDNKWIEENGRNETPTVAEVEVDPLEIAKAQLVMLMRLYDIQMAILTLQDAGKADQIFDAHDVGQLFNPQLFIPGE